MRKFNYILPILASAAFILVSCKSSEEATASAEATSEVPVKASDVAAEGSSVVTEDTTERTFFASIERTACFGMCPTYTMTIYSDGFVEYNGIRAVDKIGKYTRTITQVEMDSIVNQAREIKFLEMEDEYDDKMVMDLPSATTTVVIDGTKKSVMRRYGHPKRILTLEVLFDNIMNRGSWLSEDGEVYPPER